MSSFQLLVGRPGFLYPLCVVDIAWLHFEMSLVQRSSWCGNHPGLLPVRSAPSEDPWRDPAGCQQVVCLVGFAHHVVPMAPARLLLFRRLVAHCSRRGCCRRHGCILLVRWSSKLASVVSSSSSQSGSLVRRRRRRRDVCNGSTLCGISLRLEDHPQHPS